MIGDRVGQRVRVSPRTGNQLEGVLASVDDYGLTLDNARPTSPRDAAFPWGTVHLPWRNVAATHLHAETEGERS